MGITYDIGNNQIAEYKLCKNCKNMPVFRDFIINEEAILENKTTEVEFTSHTSADTSPRREMIT